MERVARKVPGGGAAERPKARKVPPGDKASVNNSAAGDFIPGTNGWTGYPAGLKTAAASVKCGNTAISYQEPSFNAAKDHFTTKC